MIRDIFIEANAKLAMSESVTDPEKYIQLNDTILNFIERGSDDGFDKARALLLRIRQRKLYFQTNFSDINAQIKLLYRVTCVQY